MSLDCASELPTLASFSAYAKQRSAQDLCCFRVYSEKKLLFYHNKVTCDNSDPKLYIDSQCRIIPEVYDLRRYSRMSVIFVQRSIVNFSQSVLLNIVQTNVIKIGVSLFH